MSTSSASSSMSVTSPAWRYTVRSKAASKGSPRSTSSRRASRASRSRRPAGGGAARTTDGSGRKSFASFARLLPDGSWSRTYQGCSQLRMDGSSEAFSGTWPRSGTMRSGTAFLRRPLAHRTSGTGSGSLQRVPTPIERDAYLSTYMDPEKVMRSAEERQDSLTRYVAMWPTPLSVPDGERSHGQLSGRYREAMKRALWPTPRAGNPGSRPNRKGGRVLAEEVKKFPTPTSSMVTMADMEQARFSGLDPRRPKYGEAKRRTEETKFPTPSARDWKSGQASARTMSRNSRPLSEVVLWRTPQARDGEPRGATSPEDRARQGHSVSLHDQAGGQLNPIWVCWLMGYPLDWTWPTWKKPLVEWLRGSIPAGARRADLDGVPIRVAKRVPERLNQLKAIGNSIVPQVAEFILRLRVLGGGEHILDVEKSTKSWPTPTVCGNYNRKGASKTSRDGLATAVKKVTP